MRATVFLNYSRHDRPQVERLHADLTRAGFDVFYDAEVTGGEAWWDRILAEIRTRSVFMPVVSGRWLDSRPCEVECEYAMATNRRVLPVSLEDNPRSALPTRLAATHVLPLRPGDPNSTLEIIAALNSFPPEPPALPTPLPAQPAVPISAAHMLRDRIKSRDDLDRGAQVLLLADLKSAAPGLDDQEVDGLVKAFRARHDLIAQVAVELDAMRPSTPAGWYQDPQYPTMLRYWDGHRWTDNRTAGNQHQPAPSPPRPSVQHQPAPSPPGPSVQHQPAPSPPGPSVQHQPGSSPQRTPLPPPVGNQHAAPARSNTGGKIVASFVLAAVAVICLPIVFGPIAIWLGYSADKDGNPTGRTAMIVAIIATVVGMILGIALLASSSG